MNEETISKLKNPNRYASGQEGIVTQAREHARVLRIIRRLQIQPLLDFQEILETPSEELFKSTLGVFRIKNYARIARPPWKKLPVSGVSEYATTWRKAADYIRQVSRFYLGNVTISKGDELELGHLTLTLPATVKQLRANYALSVTLDVTVLDSRPYYKDPTYTYITYMKQKNLKARLNGSRHLPLLSGFVLDGTLGSTPAQTQVNHKRATARAVTQSLNF